MTRRWLIPVTVLLLLVAGLALWLEQRAGGPQLPIQGPGTQPASAPAALRIGIIPERDIYAQRQRYKVLADYLSAKLGRPVQLVSVSTYQAVLQDLAGQQVDVAFLGSLVAVLTVDRLQTQVLVKPELPGGISTYRGVIFVRSGSPIQRVEDLAGKSIAMVRTTTGGNLFPIHQLMEKGLLSGPNPPRLIWVGTHDEAIYEVLAGRADAGAVKDLRLNEFDAASAAHPKLHRLAQSDSVPENALVIRADLATSLGPQLTKLLLEMDRDAQGQKALAGFGAVRFLPCRVEEYKAIYDMVDRLGQNWRELGVAGPAPKRP